MPSENQEREGAEIICRLKRLALDTNTAIVATAELSANPDPGNPSQPGPPWLTFVTPAPWPTLPITFC